LSNITESTSLPEVVLAGDSTVNGKGLVVEKPPFQSVLHLAPIKLEKGWKVERGGQQQHIRHTSFKTQTDLTRNF
jgi:hypothetical protein